MYGNSHWFKENRPFRSVVLLFEMKQKGEKKSHDDCPNNVYRKKPGYRKLNCPDILFFIYMPKEPEADHQEIDQHEQIAA